MSCKKYLDISPDGRVTMEKVWGADKSSLGYLNSAYETMGNIKEGQWHWDQTWLDGSSDLFHDSDPAGISYNWYQGSLNPNNDPHSAGDGYNKATVGNYWSGIRKCNVFIKNIGSAVVNEEQSRRRLKAEAIVLRAYYYTELCRKFGPMPILKQELPMDVDFSTLERPADMQQLADFINESWMEVKDVAEFPWRLQNPSERGRVTKAVMLLLRARVQLFAASPLWNPSNDLSRWQKARDYAKEAIDLLSVNGFRLYHDVTLGEKSFEEYFITAADYGVSPRDRETILEHNNSSSFWIGWPGHNNTFPQRTDQFKAGICPTQELVDAFDVKSTGYPVLDPVRPYLDDTHLNPNYSANSAYDVSKPYENRDPRFYATVFYNGSFSPGSGLTVETFMGGGSEIRENDRRFTKTGYYLRKYIDQNVGLGQVPGTIWKKMRFAEFYLILAEAENELNGPNQEVYSALKVIRDRVHMPNVKSGITSQGIMRAHIQKEWTTEFAVEERRFWNVRRWKIISKTDKLVTGMRITKQPNGSFTYQRIVVSQRNSWEDRFLIYPIPATEISVFGIQWQNPGW